MPELTVEGVGTFDVPEGKRLSSQILCDHDMSVRADSRLAGSVRKDAGPRPADAIP